MLRIRAIVPALFALSIAACGGGGDGGNPTGPTGNNNNPNNPKPGGGHTVTLTADSFSPASMTVPVNTTVTWNWDSCTTTGDGYGGYGQTCVSHNVLFDDGTTSGLQSSGSFTRHFDTAGEFNYHCSVHGAAMSGKITVQ
jgi:plastocyanin